jgi:hypothetical protein
MAPVCVDPLYSFASSSSGGDNASETDDDDDDRCTYVCIFYPIRSVWSIDDVVVWFWCHTVELPVCCPFAMCCVLACRICRNTTRD